MLSVNTSLALDSHPLPSPSPQCLGQRSGRNLIEDLGRPLTYTRDADDAVSTCGIGICRAIAPPAADTTTCQPPEKQKPNLRTPENTNPNTSSPFLRDNEDGDELGQLDLRACYSHWQDLIVKSLKHSSQAPQISLRLPLGANDTRRQTSQAVVPVSAAAAKSRQNLDNVPEAIPDLDECWIITSVDRNG